MSASEKILSCREAGVGTITFNNPERHNAVSLDMWETTAGILEDFRTDDQVRVVVLTGAGGKAFVSGADISKFETERGTEEARERYNTAVERLYGEIHRFPKPTIAMIRGYCIGGGLGLAVACDLRICTENSRFALPAARLGLGYGFNGLKRFVDTVGPAFTKEIFFTAKQYTSAEALRMSLVNRVVADGELENAVRELSETIAGNAPLTVAATKHIVTQILEDEMQRDRASCDAVVQRCFTSNDYQEGRKAFMEKRKPAFTGT
jgi:enoyl-CoA hydratase